MIDLATSTADLLRCDQITTGKRKRHLDPQKVAELADSIAEVGLLNPILVQGDWQKPEGKFALVAGRHRLEAFRSLGLVEIPVNVVDGMDALDAELAEIDENLIRNELTALERAEHIAARKVIYEKRHPETKQGGAPGKAGGGKKAKTDKMSGFATDAAAKTGVDPRTVRRDVQIANDIPEPVRDAIRDTPVADNQTELLELARLHKNHPEEAEAVVSALASGDAAHVGDARKQAKAAKKREANLELAKAAPAVDERYRLICADLKDADLADNSIDCIITDPPYPEEFLPCYADLAALAARVLKPGGSLLAMAGHFHLPTVLASMTQHLAYHWIIAYLMPASEAAIWSRKVMTEWKPVLWFVKGDYAGEMVRDVARSQQADKEHHEWGQSESGMADLVEKFTKPGEVILDPFLGGGTTAVVAVQMARQFIGVDIDPEAVATTKARLAALNAGSDTGTNGLA